MQSENRGVSMTSVAGMTVYSAFATAFYREIANTGQIVTLGSFTLNAVDLTFLSALSLLFWRLHTQRFALNFTSLLVMVFALIYAIDVARGAISNLLAALSAVRLFGTSVLLMLAFVTFRSDATVLLQIRRALMICAFGICGLILVRAVFGASFLRFESNWEDARSVSAQGALVIAGAAVSQLALVLRGRRYLNGRSLLLFLVLAFFLAWSRQGTAMVCGVVGSIIVFAFQRGNYITVRFALSVFTTLAISVFYLAAPELLDPAYWASFSTSTSEFTRERQQTFEDRKIVWQGVQTAFNNMDFLSRQIGEPTGGRISIMLDHPSWGYVEWLNGYHSMYYTVLMTCGQFGLMFFISLFCMALRNCWKYRNNISIFPYGQTSSLYFAYVVMSALFSYTYDLQTEGMFFLISGLYLPSAFASKHQKKRYDERGLPLQVVHQPDFKRGIAPWRLG